MLQLLRRWCRSRALLSQLRLDVGLMMPLLCCSLLCFAPAFWRLLHDVREVVRYASSQIQAGMEIPENRGYQNMIRSMWKSQKIGDTRAGSVLCENPRNHEIPGRDPYYVEIPENRRYQGGIHCIWKSQKTGDTRAGSALCGNPRKQEIPGRDRLYVEIPENRGYQGGIRAMWKSQKTRDTSAGFALCGNPRKQEIPERDPLCMFHRIYVSVFHHVFSPPCVCSTTDRRVLCFIRSLVDSV